MVKISIHRRCQRHRITRIGECRRDGHACGNPQQLRRVRSAIDMKRRGRWREAQLPQSNSASVCAGRCGSANHKRHLALRSIRIHRTYGVVVSAACEQRPPGSRNGRSQTQQRNPRAAYHRHSRAGERDFHRNVVTSIRTLLFLLGNAKLAVSIRIHSRTHQRTGQSQVVTRLPAAADHTKVAVAGTHIPDIVVKLSGNHGSPVVQSRRDPDNTKHLPVKPFLRISDRNQISGLQSDGPDSRLKLDVSVPANCFVQLEPDNASCLIEIRKPQRTQACAHFLARRNRVFEIHQGQAVLLVLIEFILEFRGEPVRRIGRTPRPQSHARLAVILPHDVGERRRPVAKFVRRPSGIQGGNTVRSRRLVRVLQADRVLRVQLQQSIQAISEIQARSIPHAANQIGGAAPFGQNQVALKPRDRLCVAI